MTEKADPTTESGALPPVFLERQSYRRRRLMDAARLLPIFGALLFAVPLLWPMAGDEGDPMPMSTAIMYIFSAWAGLIFVSAVFGRAVRLLGRSEESSASEQG